MGEQDLAPQRREPVDGVAEVQLQALDEVPVRRHPVARAPEHVRRVVGHQVADARQVVAAARAARRGERVEPALRLLAVADAELHHVDLLRQLRPLVEPVQRAHERGDLVVPEVPVGAVGDAAGERRRVVLLERGVPRREVPPVAAVERPHHALARADPLLEVDALVDVGDDAQRLREPVDDLCDELPVLHVPGAPDVDGDLGQRAVRGREHAGLAAERADHDGRAEVAPVLHPVEHGREPRVVEVDGGRRLGDGRQDPREVLRLGAPYAAQLDHHPPMLRRPDRRGYGPSAGIRLPNG